MTTSAIVTAENVVEYGGNRRKIVFAFEKPSKVDGIAAAERFAVADPSIPSYLIVTENAASTRFAEGKSFRLSFDDYAIPVEKAGKQGDGKP